MKIYIPHLHYTVFVKDRKKYAGNEIHNAVTVRENHNSSTVYMSLPIKRKDYGTLTHELVHVLQFISDDRDIHFSEQEHFGYLMQFLFNEATGYSYV